VVVFTWNVEVVVVNAFVVVVTEDADKMTANAAAENRSLMIDLFFVVIIRIIDNERL
jgi:hypothetical protein